MRPAQDTLFLPGIPDGTSVSSRVVPWQRWGEGGGLSFTRETLEARDHLVLADNLSLLAVLPSGTIDLIYIDPPFATGRRRESPRGDGGPEGFDDRRDDPDDFVGWLAPRLTGLWRVLARSGSIVIHLDARAVHHVRVFCDREFGSSHWENEIVWHYTGGGRSKRRFSRKHDVLLWYSKSPDRIFNIDAIREPYKPTSGYAKGGIVSRKGKKYMPHPHGTPADDVWDIPIVNPMADERTPYPTQKPLRLIERVVSALSCEGMVVADLFSGSGTTALACRRLGRRFVCCDSNPDAIGITFERLHADDPDSPPPALVSHGMYRLRYATERTAPGLGNRLAWEGLRMTDCPEPEIIFPLWRGTDSPPRPLGRHDAVARFQAVDLGGRE